jgi:hypothetical protein
MQRWARSNRQEDAAGLAAASAVAVKSLIGVFLITGRVAGLQDWQQK